MISQDAKTVIDPNSTSTAGKALKTSARLRLQGLSKHARALAERVERNELSLPGFLREVVLGLGDPRRGRDDVSLGIANDALVYLRRRGDTDREWLIDLLERHAGLVYMRRTGGRLHRFTLHGRQELIHALDEPKLVSELQQKLCLNDDVCRRTSARTLFDQSTEQQTMRASKYAK